MASELLQSMIIFIWCKWDRYLEMGHLIHPEFYENKGNRWIVVNCFMKIIHNSLRKGCFVLAMTVLVCKAINSSGKLWEGWNLSAIICIVLFFPIKAHPEFYFTSVLTIPAWVSLFYNCSPMLLISFFHTLHAMHIPDKIWYSKWSEFSSFSSISSQQQIKTYATLLSWHNFFHLCWGNALEHIQHWQ